MTIKENMDTKPIFVDTIHCLSRKHCDTCRNLEGGRKWRGSIKELFVIPNESVDFQCPYGKEWHDGLKKVEAPAIGATQTLPVPLKAPTPACTPCQRKRQQQQQKAA